MTMETILKNPARAAAHYIDQAKINLRAVADFRVSPDQAIRLVSASGQLAIASGLLVVANSIQQSAETIALALRTGRGGR